MHPKNEARHAQECGQRLIRVAAHLVDCLYRPGQALPEHVDEACRAVNRDRWGIDHPRPAAAWRMDQWYALAELVEIVHESFHLTTGRYMLADQQRIEHAQQLQRLLSEFRLAFRAKHKESGR